MQKLGLVLLVIGLFTMATLLFSWGWDWYRENGFDQAKGTLICWLERLKFICPFNRNSNCSVHMVNRLHEPSIYSQCSSDFVPTVSLEGISPLFQEDESSMRHVIPEVEFPVLAADGSVPYEEPTIGESSMNLNGRGEEKDSPLLILHVVPHQDEVIYGPLLLRSILQLGLRHGDKSIFHRHRDPVGNGPVLFSLVNMVQPGTFNISSMGEFTTHGVSFFMTIPSYGDTMQNFKLMLQAGHRLADDIGGVVLDDQRRILTLQKSDHYKARIRHLLTEKTSK